MGVLTGAMQLLIFGMLFLNINGEPYYVKTANGTCNGIQNCHTLEDYAVNKSRYFENDNDIILMFYEGIHESSVTVELFNVSSVSLLPLGTGAVSIVSDFALEDIKMLVLQGVCVRGQVLATAKDVRVEQCNLESGPVNMSNIQTVRFESVNLYGSSSSRESLQLTLACDACSYIEISHSTFSDATTTIITEQCNTTGNTVIFVDNVHIGGEMSGSSFTNFSSVNITAIDTKVDILNSTITESNGGLSFRMTRSNLVIANCSILKNDMSGIYIVTHESGNNIAIEDTLVAENRLQDVSSGNPYRWFVPNGVGLSVNPGPNRKISQASYNLFMKNVTFQNNFDENYVPKVAFIFNSQNTTVSDCHFLGNHGTAMAVYLTTAFIVTGNTEFIGNHAYEGGALLLFSVYLTITDNSQLLFENNDVDNVGGAICVRNIPIQIDSGQPCFYQLDTVSNSTNLSLTFANNTAQKGGDDIYGGTTSTSCTALVHSNEYTYGNPYNHIFHFDSKFDAVTSEPTRVCLCNQGQAQCADFDSIFIEKELYPGEVFALQLIVVGADFGGIAGSVVAQIDPQSSLSNLQGSQSIQNSACNNLSYAVHSEPNRVAQMTLSINGSAPNQWYTNKESTIHYIQKYNETGKIDINLLTTPLYLNIYMKPCPPGLSLTHHNVCDCAQKMTETFNTVLCHIKDDNIFVTRGKKFWISVANTSDTNSSVLFSNDCLGYKCNQTEQILDLSNPDKQCVNERAGQLCGRCKQGYVLALGSEKCAECPTNLYLLLIPVFGVLGVMLVVLIKLLDLTVADGYINGLILFCNIVWINKHRLLQDVPKGFTFLNVFLAWFNLDFGIETCFSTGLTTYIYTWLQLIFPIYVLLIGGIIILLAQKVNVLGNNVVPVLATLLLLSYYKFLVIIVSILRIAVITEVTDQAQSRIFLVWESDGNIEYASKMHIPLFVVALFLLVFFCLPYTLTLLFSRHLNRIQSIAMTRWMLKLKPIFDAYSGPFQPKRDYWVGLLLLLRALLLLSSILTYGKHSAIYNAILIVTMSGLFFFKLFFGRVYKTKRLALMENVSILNLIAISSAGFLPDTEARSYITCIFVGLALVQFLLLVVAKVVLLIRARIHYQRTGLTIASDLQHRDAYSSIDHNDRSGPCMLDDNSWLEQKREFSISQLSVT